MSLLPGAGTGQSKKVTGRALITFKLSFALSPTLHLFSTTSHFAPKLDTSLGTLAIQRKAPQVFFCRAGALPVPPHLSELEDASCADVLGRGHLDWAVLAVLIQLQDLNPQLHFACHLTPPATQAKYCVVSCVWLGSFPPKVKGI